MEAALEAPAGVVEDLAHVGAARDELVARCVDVVDREHQAIDRARLGGRDPVTENDDAFDPGGVSWTRW
jgi:hypothetical protein